MDRRDWQSIGVALVLVTAGLGLTAINLMLGAALVFTGLAIAGRYFDVV